MRSSAGAEGDKGQGGCRAVGRWWPGLGRRLRRTGGRQRGVEVAAVAMVLTGTGGDRARAGLRGPAHVSGGSLQSCNYITGYLIWNGLGGMNYMKRCRLEPSMVPTDHAQL